MSEHNDDLYNQKEWKEFHWSWNTRKQQTHCVVTVGRKRGKVVAAHNSGAKAQEWEWKAHSTHQDMHNTGHNPYG